MTAKLLESITICTKVSFREDLVSKILFNNVQSALHPSCRHSPVSKGNKCEKKEGKIKDAPPALPM